MFTVNRVNLLSILSKNTIVKSIKKPKKFYLFLGLLTAVDKKSEYVVKPGCFKEVDWQQTFVDFSRIIGIKFLDGLRTLDSNRGCLVNQLESKIGSIGGENKSIIPRFCLFSFYLN